jgi:ADP-ribosylglycohydrolase
MNEETLRDRRLGTILAGAIGDALGHPTEFMSLSSIYEKYGVDGVQGFSLWRKDPETGKEYSPYTDDTQMAEVVLRTILSAQLADLDEEHMFEKMAEGFVEWARNPQGGHRAPGGACMSGCRALGSGVPWREAGGPSAGGCGSVMRCYPFGLFFEPDEAERLAVAHSAMTHRDPIALAACAAMARGVALNLRDVPVDEVIQEMIAAAARYSEQTAEMMTDAWEQAKAGTHADVVLSRYEGWAAHDAIAATVYLFACFPEDPKGAMLRGVTSKGDSDSLGTLAGAIVASRTGLKSLPEDLVRDVERSEVFLSILD